MHKNGGQVHCEVYLNPSFQPCLFQGQSSASQTSGRYLLSVQWSHRSASSITSSALNMLSFAPSLLARALDQNGIDPNNINTTTTDPLTIAMSRKYCKVGTCPSSWQVIDYRPSLAGNATYMSAFILLLLTQAYFGVRHKTWKYTAILLTGLLGEIVGYAGRLTLNANPFLMNNFLVWVSRTSLGDDQITDEVKAILFPLRSPPPSSPRPFTSPSHVASSSSTLRMPTHASSPNCTHTSSLAAISSL